MHRVFFIFSILAIWFKSASVLWYLRTACNQELQLLFVILRTWSKPLWTWTHEQKHKLLVSLVVNPLSSCFTICTISVMLFVQIVVGIHIVTVGQMLISQWSICLFHPILPHKLQKLYTSPVFSVKHVYKCVSNTCCIQNSLFQNNLQDSCSHLNTKVSRENCCKLRKIHWRADSTGTLIEINFKKYSVLYKRESISVCFIL